MSHHHCGVHTSLTTCSYFWTHCIWTGTIVDGRFSDLSMAVKTKFASYWNCRKDIVWQSTSNQTSLTGEGFHDINSAITFSVRSFYHYMIRYDYLMQIPEGFPITADLGLPVLSIVLRNCAILPYSFDCNIAESITPNWEYLSFSSSHFSFHYHQLSVSYGFTQHHNCISTNADKGVFLALSHCIRYRTVTRFHNSFHIPVSLQVLSWIIRLHKTLDSCPYFSTVSRKSWCNCCKSSWALARKQTVKL